LNEVTLLRLALQGVHVEIDPKKLDVVLKGDAPEFIVAAHGDRYELLGGYPKLCPELMHKDKIQVRLMSKQLLKRCEALSTPGTMVENRPQEPRYQMYPVGGFRRSELAVISSDGHPQQRTAMADAFKQSSSRRS
jgi:hypothetical protein